MGVFHERGHAEPEHGHEQVTRARYTGCCDHGGHGHVEPEHGGILKTILVEGDAAQGTPTPGLSTPGEPTLVLTQLEVMGMCCQSEVTLVKRKLEVLPGVSAIRVNLMLRQVSVTHEESLEPARLVRTLNWALLDARIVDKASGGSLLQKGRRNYTTYLAILCGVLFAVSLGVWKRVTTDHAEWWEDPFTYFALACVAAGGPLLIVRALAGLVHDRTINMFFTMSLAMVGALVLTDFFEAAAIVFFFVLCEWVQKWCVHHTAAMTRGLGGLLPEIVTPADGGEEKPIDEVQVGEVLLVKPGGRVPVDGTVVGKGSSSVDESMLTGESQPLVKTAGCKVVAGTTNQTGVLEVRWGYGWDQRDDA